MGHGTLIEVSRFQKLRTVLDFARVRRPKDELTHGVGKDGTCDTVAFGHGLFRRLGVSSQQNVIGRTVFDLAVEHAGRTKTQNNLVAGLRFKNRREFFGRRREVGGHRHVNFIGKRRRSRGTKDSGNGCLHKTVRHFLFPLEKNLFSGRLRHKNKASRPPVSGE